MKLPKADRYKTVSLKTADIGAARERAFDQDADIRFRIKHDVPVFNRPFREVAREYLLTHTEARAMCVRRSEAALSYGERTVRLASMTSAGVTCRMQCGNCASHPFVQGARAV